MPSCDNIRLGSVLGGVGVGLGGLGWVTGVWSQGRWGPGLGWGPGGLRVGGSGVGVQGSRGSWGGGVLHANNDAEVTP